MLEIYKYLFFWYKSKYIKKNQLNTVDLGKVFDDELNDEIHEKSIDMLVNWFNLILLSIFLFFQFNFSLIDFSSVKDLHPLNQKILLLPVATVLFFVVTRYFKNKFRKHKEEINKMNFNDFTKKYKLKMFVIVWCFPPILPLIVIILSVVIQKYW